MSIQDDNFSAGKDHEVAMAVRSTVTGIADLCGMENADLFRQDAIDLELAYSQLGRLLSRLTSTRRAA